MLLGRVLGELSHLRANLYPSGDDEDMESSDSEVEYNAGLVKSSPELNLHLECEREFFNRLFVRRKELLARDTSECSEGDRCSIAVPFEWEEKPGKPKDSHQLVLQNSTVAALTLPPVRQSCHVGRDISLVANSPSTLSTRLRNILQPKFSAAKFYETKDEAGEPEKVALDVGVHYPEEFAWRSLRHSSPVSIFEGPDGGSPSSSSNLSLLSYCSGSNNNRLALSSSSARHNYVPALMANRLIPATEMLNAVPVDNSTNSLVPVERGNIGTGRAHQDLGNGRTMRDPLAFASLNKSSKGPSNGRNYNGSRPRSVSFGGAELDFISEGLPQRVLIPEGRLEHCPAIVGRKVHARSFSVAVPVVSTSICASGLHLSKNSSIESAKLGFPKGSSRVGHYHSSGGYPQRNKNLDKAKRGCRDSDVEADSGQSNLIEDYERKFQDVKVKTKKRQSSMHHRMNLSGCCSSSASRTINCCSSRSATRTNNHSRHTEKKGSLPKHQKLKTEWRQLQENDDIQK